MDNPGRTEAGEFPLPEVLIQRIQYYLKAKQAAQTCILSKSWHAAWSTRPNLDFDQHDFLNRDDERFWVLAENTMQRYEALNLKIESFRFCVHYLKRPNYNLAGELIVKATKMGAVELKFEISYCNELLGLPLEVLGSESLVRLCVRGCKIDVGPDTKLCCPKLKSLYLNEMLLEGDILSDLISNCPLIEKLTLASSISARSHNDLFFTNMSSNFPRLKKFCLSNCIGFNFKGIEISHLSLKCKGFNFAREWETDISVTCYFPSAAWFLNLNELLTCLGFSKIDLCIRIWSNVEKGLDFQAMTKTAVENLAIYAPCSSWFMALKCVFRSCRPKFVTLYHVPEGIQRANTDDFVENIRRGNVERVREICLMMNAELENVINLEFSKESLQVSPLSPHKVHFQLRWRKEPI